MVKFQKIREKKRWSSADSDSFVDLLHYMKAMWLYHQGCIHLALQCNELNPTEEDINMKIVLVKVTKDLCAREAWDLGRGIFDEAHNILSSLSADVPEPYKIMNNICARHIYHLREIANWEKEPPYAPIYSGPLVDVPLHLPAPPKGSKDFSHLVSDILDEDP
jgi:hypothetical protein